MAKGDSIRSCRRRPATSWASWPSRSTAMARHDPRVPAGGDRPAAAGPADGAGDDRLVPRPGGGRRSRPGPSSGPTRRRAGSSASSPSTTARSPGPRRRCCRPALTEVLGGRPDYLPTSLDHALCLRDGGQERFYLPRVLAIRGDDGLLGAAVVLPDVTKFRLVDQLKSDMVSTVSHELKTPLTSVQMAVHLLLEEVVGPADAQAGRAAAGGPAGLGPAAGDGQRPARPDPDRAGAASGSTCSPVAPADLVGEADRPVRGAGARRRHRAQGRRRASACRRSWSIASGSATSSTT